MSARDPPVPWTVLVVDDEPHILRVIRLVLRRLDCRVLEAAGPEAALQIATAYPGPIHLLMADVSMPVMNGMELSRRLGSLRPGLQVLYISGHSREELVANGCLDSSAPFLAKPWRTDDLIGQVTKLLGA